MPFQRIEIKPSLTLALALCAAYLAAGAAIWFALPPPWLARTLISTIAGALAWEVYSRALLGPARAVVALEIAASGRIALLTRGGSWRACELLGTSYVSPRLTILNLRIAGSRWPRHVVIVPDNVDRDHFRRLRTWLRWAHGPEAGSHDELSGFP